MFLTREELQTLTGLRRPSAIASWLSNHGWQFVFSRSGWPVVARAEAELHLVSPAGRAPATPNLELVP